MKPSFFPQITIKKLLKKLRTTKAINQFSFVKLFNFTLRISKIAIVSSVWNARGAKITIDPFNK